MDRGIVLDHFTHPRNPGVIGNTDGGGEAGHPGAPPQNKRRCFNPGPVIKNYQEK